MRNSALGQNAPEEAIFFSSRDYRPEYEEIEAPPARGFNDMTTDEKIVEMAGAVRLLAWYVQRLSETAPPPARREWAPDLEMKEVRDSMQKLQEACHVVATPRTE